MGKAYKVDGEMADCWIDHAVLTGLVLVDLARIVPRGSCCSTLHLLGQLDMQILVGSDRDELLAGIRGRVVGTMGAAERDSHTRPGCSGEQRWRAQGSVRKGAGWPAETSSDARHWAGNGRRSRASMASSPHRRRLSLAGGGNNMEPSQTPLTSSIR